MAWPLDSCDDVMMAFDSAMVLVAWPVVSIHVIWWVVSRFACSLVMAFVVIIVYSVILLVLFSVWLLVC